MSDLPHLTYFGFRGLGESVRLMLEDLGVAYRETRTGGDDWDALKPTLPFGQVPVLEIGGRRLVQSLAICRHLARQHGAYGADETQHIHADATADAFKDAQNALMEHFWSDGSDAPAAMAGFEAGRLTQDLAALERWLGEGPYFGGAEPVFADYYALTYLEEVAAYFPAAVAAKPGLGAFIARMLARPGIAAYAASGRRPPAYGFDPIRNLRMGLTPPATPPPPD